jgi:hypothetical protein
VSATFTAGSGGTGCGDDYTVSIDGGAAVAYTPGSSVGGSATSSIVLQGRRANCTAGSGCTGTGYTTLASWTVVAQPVGPTLLAKLPTNTTICTGTTVSATFNAGSGGAGCSDNYIVIIDGGSPAAYTPGSSVGGSATTSIVIQGRRANCTYSSGCNGTSYVTLASWSVVAQPVGPTLLLKTPNLATICTGTTVSATFTAGSGGTGCGDDYTVSIDGGAAVAYTPGSSVGGTATTSIEIKGRRANCTSGSGCTGTGYATLASWAVVAQPVGPTLNVKTPNIATVCTGTNVKATFTAGTGGVGCGDSYQYSTDNGTTWNAYTGGTDISTTGSTGVIIQGKRNNCDAYTGCTGTSFVTLASWAVVAQPVGPTLLLKTPNVASLCPGTSVKATFTAGTGGVGCGDSYQYSTDNGTTWNAYTGGTDISTTGSTGVIIQGKRNNCDALTGCTGTSFVTLASWSVLAPTLISSITASKTSWTYGCESATITVNATGEGTLSYQWHHKYTAGSITDQLVGINDPSYTVPELSGAGTHEYWVVVTGGCGSKTSDHVIITINPQPAGAPEGQAYYTGPSIAYTANPTSSTATFTLSAFIQNTANCGDIATARLTFWYRVAGSGTFTKVPNGTNLPVNYVNPQIPSMGGTASVIAQLNIGSQTCELYDILVTIGGNYTGQDALALDQISITKPQPGGTISGGAKLKYTNSVGWVKASRKTDLGFFVNYTMKNGTAQNPKGKVNLCVRSYNDRYGNLTNTIHTYKITSNAIASLVVGQPTPEKRRSHRKQILQR